MLGFGPMLMEARNHRYVCFAFGHLFQMGTCPILRRQSPSASIGFLIMCLLTASTSQNKINIQLEQPWPHSEWGSEVPGGLSTPGWPPPKTSPAP